MGSKQKVCLAAAGLLVSAMLAGCSNSADASGQSSEAGKTGEKLKVAVLFAGQTSDFGKAVHDGFMNKAAELGVQATAFDAGFDPNKQFSQLQTVISSGQYNAIAVHSLVGEQMCKTLQAQVAKGTPVVAMDQPVCMDPLAAFKDSAPKGLTAFAGGDASVDQYSVWAQKTVADNPGKKILVLNGPEGSAVSATLHEVTAKAVAQANNGATVLHAFTDFSQAMAQSQTASLLVSNPDINVIAVSGGEMARGALAAAKSTNAQNVKISVYAGDQASLDMMKAGDVTLVHPARPFTAGAEAAKLLADIQSGKDAPSLVFTPDSEPNRPPATILTPDNVGDYKAEY